jgi:ribosomal protein L36
MKYKNSLKDFRGKKNHKIIRRGKKVIVITPSGKKFCQ